MTGRDRGDFEINEEGQLSFRTPGPREAGGLEQGQRVPGDGEGVGREVLRDAGRGGDGEEVNEAPEIASSSKTEISYEENKTSDAVHLSGQGPGR